MLLAQIHRCPECELTVQAANQWTANRCPRCLVNDGKGVAMAGVSLGGAAVAVASVPR